MPYVIETTAVMPTGSDFAVSTAAKSHRSRSLAANLRSSADSVSATSADMAAAESAVRPWRVSTKGTDMAMVIPPTGRLLVSGFNEIGILPAASFHLSRMGY
ncbi:unnamed protein product [Pylaiella littoralis]